MWRKVSLLVLVGLLISGLLGVTLAESPPRRGFGGNPGPRPVQWGDPDWPSYSREAGVTKRIAVDDRDMTIPPDRIDAREVWAGSARDGQAKRVAPSRLYTLRVLGLTIVIRR
jgi:hypothetical protein